MVLSLFKKLQQQQLISDEEFENIKRKQEGPLPVYCDVTALLYIGILLFTSGLAILVYNNIDTIGHAVMIALIAVLCTACFFYCFQKAKGYSKVKVESPTLLFDYVLLLGCLLLLTFVGYLQFEYQVFGKNWGMATFVPMVLLFLTAYYFDHLGVLSMAITNLAAWAGFTVAPLHIITENNFRDEKLIYTGVVLGLGLLALSLATTARGIKAHFSSTYKNFGTHILFISLLAALFHFDRVYLIWFVLLSIVVVFFFMNALKEGSFYFLVISILYGYIGLSYVISNVLWHTGGGEGVLYLGLIYFIASGVGFIRVLMHYNKLLNRDAHL